MLTDGDYYAQVTNLYWVRDGQAYQLLGSQNWNSAQAAAVALGGNLVTIDDGAENSFLYRAFGGWNSFIGFHDASSTNTFEWVDGTTPITYTNWASGEPNTSSYDAAYLHTNSLWYDSSKSSSRPAIAEFVDPLSRTSAGPGSLAQYLLNVTVSDPVPPAVTSVSRLPDGGTTTQQISTFNANFTESLLPNSVNNPQFTFSINPANNHLYALAHPNQTWSQSEALAQSLGGHLVTINDAAENDWVSTTFGSFAPYLWIGLTDRAVEGDWGTWNDGTPVGYSSWASGYPRVVDNYDDGYLNVSNRLWYDYPSSTSSNWRGVMEFTNSTDTDGDGIPDVLDFQPNDSLNSWDLREAGDDGVFDTADDDVYDLRPSSTYSGGTTVGLRVYDGPMQDGDYRLTFTPAITDVVGNALDGNGDGTGGDAFTRLFSVDLADGFVYEGRNNSSLGDAQALTLVEDPSGQGLYVTDQFGLGSIDPSSDGDWWSFQGQAGDRVSISADTPSSGLRTWVGIYNSGGSNLTANASSGPDDNGFISNYGLPYTGTFYIYVQRGGGSSVGEYQLRVELARGIQMESDYDYSNDSFSGANTISLTQTGNERSGTIAGSVMDRQGSNTDEDRFYLGLLNAGNVIDANVTLPSSSSLVTSLRVFRFRRDGTV